MEVIEFIKALTVGQIIEYCAGIFAVICAILEFNKKININPISSLLSWIGKKTNSYISADFDELRKQITELSGQIESLKNTVDRNEAVADERNAEERRVRILRFGDELRTHSLHSKDSFDQVLNDIDVYDTYCSEHPEFKNHQTVATKELIIEAYQHCLEENSFV